MHGLIFRKSIHYWQDQPGSRRPLKAAGQKGVTRKNTGTQVLGEKITTVHEPAAILAGPQVSPNPFFRRPGPTRSAPPRPAAFFGMAAKISRNRPPKEALSRRDRQPSLARLAIFPGLRGCITRSRWQPLGHRPPVWRQFSRFGIAARDSQRTRCAGGAGHA